MSRRILTTTLLLAAIAPAFAAAAPRTSTVADGPVKVDVRVDRDSAQVAEPIRLVLEVEAPRGTHVELPQLAEKLGDFDVEASERTRDIPATANGDSRRWSLTATLETIKTGKLEIPALDVHYAIGKDASAYKTLATKPVAIVIKSVLENRADPTKFRDIKSTVDVAVPELDSNRWVAWTAAGVGGAVALALATLVIVKRKRGPSAAEWALAAIADLERLPITNNADAETAYNEVVDVIREFFELEFGVPTMSRTTREFLTQAAKIVRLNQTAHDRLAALASIADEIKFARLGVGEQQVRQALEQAKAFIAECEAHRRALEKEAA